MTEVTNNGNQPFFTEAKMTESRRTARCFTKKQIPFRKKPRKSSGEGFFPKGILLWMTDCQKRRTSNARDANFS